MMIDFDYCFMIFSGNIFAATNIRKTFDMPACFSCESAFCPFKQMFRFSHCEQKQPHFCDCARTQYLIYIKNNAFLKRKRIYFIAPKLDSHYLCNIK